MAGDLEESGVGAGVSEGVYYLGSFERVIS